MFPSHPHSYSLSLSLSLSLSRKRARTRARTLTVATAFFFIFLSSARAHSPAKLQSGFLFFSFLSSPGTRSFSQSFPCAPPSRSRSADNNRRVILQSTLFAPLTPHPIAPSSYGLYDRRRAFASFVVSKIAKSFPELRFAFSYFPSRRLRRSHHRRGKFGKHSQKYTMSRQLRGF
jgi:hypothetical protein